MSQRSNPNETRLRDFIILAAGMVGMLILLWMSGALGLVPALGAAVAYLALALAYYVGSSPQKTVPGTRQENPLPAPPPEPLLHALPLPAFVIDEAGRITASNQPAAKIIGSNVPMRPRAASCIRNAALLQAIETARTREDQTALSLTYPDGPDRIWQAHVVKLGSEGNVLILLEDMTPQKRAQQARADFLANASHELRTPLSSIAGFIETMRGAARDDMQDWPRFLDIMQGETGRMSRLIDDLLSLSRIEFSEHQRPDTVIDLAPIAAAAAEALRPLSIEREIELVTDGAAHGLDILGDADEITQIVQNLLDNAIKYTPRGGRIVLAYGQAETLGEARRKAGQVWPGAGRMRLLNPAAIREDTAPGIWLRVSDSGPGISRQHLPRLGERFYRADDSRGGAAAGTGLGLAIVKHIMTRHRGGFSVESIEGEGSAFGIWMRGAGLE